MPVTTTTTDAMSGGTGTSTLDGGTATDTGHRRQRRAITITAVRIAAQTSTHTISGAAQLSVMHDNQGNSFLFVPAGTRTQIIGLVGVADLQAADVKLV